MMGTAQLAGCANTPCPLAQREQRIAKLEEEIDRLQRTEEAITAAPQLGRAQWRWVRATSA